jgi:hypothetical protein
MEDEIGMIPCGNLEREKPRWTQPIIQYPDLEAMYSFVDTKSSTNTCLAAATSMDALILKKLVNKQRRRSQVTNPEAVGSRLRERERKHWKPWLCKRISAGEQIRVPDDPPVKSGHQKT